jgi:DNA-binding MarR family transcriptional regulator
MRTSLPAGIVGDGLRRVTGRLSRYSRFEKAGAVIYWHCMTILGHSDASPLRLDLTCGHLATLRRSIRAFLAFSARVSREAGIGVDGYQALLAIRGAGDEGLTTSHLAAQLMLKPRATLDLVERLRLAELVERARDGADRRRVLVVLSAKGRLVSARLISRHLLEVQRNAPRLVAILSALSNASL